VDCPKSAKVGLRGLDTFDASLHLESLFGLFGLLGADEKDAIESVYRVDDSAVKTEPFGEFGRCLSSRTEAYACSLSAFCRLIENGTNSVPLAVRVGLDIGAEMLVPRRPCETVLTGMGERGEGPSLS
jgi:hypothetical protein